MISIVIPSFKGAKLLRQHLPDMFRRLQDYGHPFEIIIVDDGSDDQGETAQVASAFHCKYIDLEKNSGKGAAVRKGMLAAKGNFRFFTDCDIPFGTDALLLQLKYLEEASYDIVIGDRTLSESEYFSEIKGLRKFASGLFTFLVGRFVTSGLHDTQCGLKGFREDVAQDLFGVSRLNGFTFDVEILHLALKRNYKIKRTPVQFQSSHDQSSVSLLHDAPNMLIDLFRIKLSYWFGYYTSKNHKHES